MKHLTLLALTVAVSTVVLASDLNTVQPALTSGFPTDAQIDSKTDELRPQVDAIMKVAPADGSDLSRYIVGKENIVLPPAPDADAKGFDMEQVIQSYERLQITTKTNPDEPYELLVFISFSMPDAMIKLYLEQAAEWGAKIVLKGTQDGSLNFPPTQDALISLKPRKMPRIDINPKAYKLFSVDRVPTIVLAKNLPNQPLSDDGCAAPTNFLATTGEVSIPYALSLFKKTKDRELKKLIGMVESTSRGVK